MLLWTKEGVQRPMLAFLFLDLIKGDCGDNRRRSMAAIDDLMKHCVYTRDDDDPNLPAVKDLPFRVTMEERIRPINYEEHLDALPREDGTYGDMVPQVGSKELLPKARPVDAGTVTFRFDAIGTPAKERTPAYVLCKKDANDHLARVDLYFYPECPAEQFQLCTAVVRLKGDPSVVSRLFQRPANNSQWLADRHATTRAVREWPGFGNETTGTGGTFVVTNAVTCAIADWLYDKKLQVVSSA